MVERNLAIRLSVMDGGKVKAELKEIGESGEKSLKKIELAGQPASKALNALNAVANDVKGAAVGLSSGIGPLGSALMSIGPAGLAAAAGIAAIVGIVSAGTQALLEEEKAAKRLNAVLQATGYTSGLTGNQIGDFAEGLAKATGVQDEAITSAAATLAAYRSVSGDVFTETLRQAANLSAVFGGDLDSNVQALGKAMEMLAGGQAEGLRKAFKALSGPQEDLIKRLAESGRGLEAQQALLKALDSSLHDTAANLATTSSKIGVAWDDLLKHFGNTGPINWAKKELLSLLEGMNDALKPEDISVKLAAMVKQRNAILAYEEKNKGRYDFNSEFRRQQLEKLSAEIPILEKKVRLEDELRQKATAAAAQQGRDDELQHEIASEDKLVEQAKKEEEANQKIVDDLKRQLLGLRNERQAFIEQALSRLSDNADESKISQTRDIAGRLFDQKAFADAKKVLDDLARQIEKTTDKKQAFVDEYLAKLPKGISKEVIDRTKEWAAVAYDQIQAREKLDKLKEEGKQLTESDKTATEGYADQVAKLNELLNAGAISQNIYNRAKSKAAEQLLAGRTDPQAGALRAFASYQKEAENTAGAVEKAFGEAMKATEDAIVNMVTSGKISLSSLGDFADSIVADITRMFVQKSITGPLFKALSGSMESGGFLDSIMSALSFHEGGTVGETSARLMVPSYVFAGAPRYHGGGIAGLKPDEVPAILQRGEEVISRKDRKSRSAGVSVVMHITTPDANSFRASQSQISAEAARGINRAKRNL